MNTIPLFATALMLAVPALADQPLSMRGDGPAPAARPFSITRNDPAIDALIARDAKVELVANGFGLNEGTSWIRDSKGDGFLLVAGLIDNVFYKVTADKKVSVFMEQAGYTGTEPDDVGTQTRSGRSHVLLIGPTCSAVDPQGRIVWCANDDRKLMRLERDGTHTVLSDGADGHRFNGPNDITIKADGTIYLADNDFGLRGASSARSICRFSVASPRNRFARPTWRLATTTGERSMSPRATPSTVYG